jgi:hypothetical protein
MFANNALAPKTASLNERAADYQALIRHLQSTMIKRLESGRASIFRTKPKMKSTPLMDQNGISVDVYLNDVYLAALPDEAQRKHHNCSCCRHFLNDFGGLVTITADGKTHSLFFDTDTFPRDNYFFTAVERLQEVAETACIEGLHRSAAVVWGTQEEGGFTHLSVIPPVHLLHTRRDISARQQQAVLKEDYQRMAKALSEPYLSVENLTQLKRVLEAEVLAGDEKIQGVANWLYTTAVDRKNADNQRVRDNLLWRAIGSAMPGYTHPNSTLVGTVLDDIAAGFSFDEIQKRFLFKIKPDTHRRPLAPPTENHVEVAEKLIEKLGVAPSMRRRVATIGDIQDRAYVWRKLIKPTVEEPKAAGSIFGHLKTKEDKPKKELALPAATMSWNKFVTEVLPNVTDIEIYIKDQYEYFSGFMTAVDPEAPPILVYDSLTDRNTVSIYQRFTQIQEHSFAPMRMTGVKPEVWNLEPGSYYPVLGVIKAPHMWGEAKFANMAEQLVFLIKGARDLIIERGEAGLALFPQLLMEDLYSISRTIEAYSNQTKPEGDPTQAIAGLGISKGGSFNPRQLRVTSADGQRAIVIDRWE